MRTHTLQQNPSKSDDTWKFTAPADFLRSRTRSQNPTGKMIRFTQQAILLQIDQFPRNRILQDDDASKFILASFGDLRFPESTLRDTADYMKRFFNAGLFLNGVQYRFYHHSNSQLVMNLSLYASSLVN
jgi:regulator of nonsense transcripts 1